MNFIFVHAGSSDTTGTQISFQGTQVVVPFTAMQNLVLNITGKTNRGLDDTIASRWYHNGRRLFSSSSLGPLKRLRLNISQSLTLENASIYDAVQALALEMARAASGAAL